MSTLSITNFMPSTLNIPQPRPRGDKGKQGLKKTVSCWAIKPGQTVSGIDNDAFDALCEGNPAMQALVDMNRIRVNAGSEDAVVPPEQMINKTSEPELPPDLQETANTEAMGGRVKHVAETEVIVEAPAPIEKPPAAGPKRGRGRKPAAKKTAETSAAAQGG